MCLLYLYINPNPKPDGYHFILANNRDEFYRRRTNIAKFWDSDSAIIGGTDQQEGREGGTWLAMNKNGKIAVLLNILQPVDELKDHAVGRGGIVPDYVRGLDEPLDFLNKLSESEVCYNGYLLVNIGVHKNPKDTNGAFFSNIHGNPPQSLNPGISVFGNSSNPNRPWYKAAKTRDLFEDIVVSNPLVPQRDELVKNLFQMLKDPKSYGVDEQIAKQARGMSEDFVARLGSVFFTIPDINYGTRSHTIILVDALGGVEYIESSMKEPISLQDGVTWVDVREKFNLVG